MQDIKIKCKNCDNDFIAVKVNHKIPYKVENKQKGLFLTYADCPRCGNRNILQIDDIQSKIMLEDVLKMFMKSKGNKKPNSKYQERFNNARKELSEYRNSLEQNYSGQIAIESGTNKKVKIELTKEF